MGHQKCASFLVIISRCLRVPRSFIQTIGISLCEAPRLGEDLRREREFAVGTIYTFSSLKDLRLLYLNKRKAVNQFSFKIYPKLSHA